MAGMAPPQVVAGLEHLKQHRGWFRALGAAWIVLGVLAILLPLAASLAITLLVGWLLLLGGVTQVVHAFRVRSWEGFLLALVWGLLNVGVGLVLLVSPVGGVITLTIVLAAFLITEGAAKVLLAFRIRPHRPWGGFLLSGGVAIALGLLLWMGLPGSATWAIGTLVGVNMVFGGVAMLGVARAVG